MRAFFATVFLILGLACAAMAARCWYTCYRLQIDVLGQLKLAADAPSISLARERLDRAMVAVEARGLTSGSTGIFWSLPTNDVGEWYRGLKAAQANLAEFPREATEADINTALQKLRETLLDHTKEGDSVTCPDGLAYYPHNLSWAVLDVVSCVGAIVFVL
jgi:hypothetical protein